MRHILVFSVFVAPVLLAGVSCKSTSSGSDMKHVGVREPGDTGLGADRSLYIYKDEGRICLQSCDRGDFDRVYAELAAGTKTQSQAHSELVVKCTGYKSLSITDFNGFVEEGTPFYKAVTTEKIFKMNASHPQYKDLMELATTTKCGDDDIVEVGGGGNQPEPTPQPQPEPEPQVETFPAIAAGWYDIGNKWSEDYCIAEVTPQQDQNGHLQSLRVFMKCSNTTHNASCTKNGTRFECADPSQAGWSFRYQNDWGQSLLYVIKTQGDSMSQRLMEKRAGGEPRLTSCRASCEWKMVGVNPNDSNWGTNETRLEGLPYIPNPDSESGAQQEFSRQCQKKCTDSQQWNSIQYRNCTLKDFNCSWD